MNLPAPARLRTLWIGDAERAEFTAVAARLRRDTDCIERAGRSPAAVPTEAVPKEAVFDLVVAAESFPDEFAPAAYDALRRRHPAVPIVRVVGPWCDGEARSAAPPAALRIAWHRAEAWIGRQIEAHNRGEPTEFAAPATTDEFDRLLGAARRPAADAGNDARRRSTFGVWAREPAAREWLTDVASRHAQLRPVDRGAGDPVEIVLCDLATTDDAPAEIAACIRAFPGAKVIAVAGIARPRDVQALVEAGAVAVLAKPLAVAELEAAINAAVLRPR